MPTSFSDRALDFMARVLPIFGSFLFAYNAYLQIILNNDPLLSAFSLAVFLVFLLSVASVSYGHSARSGSEKEKAATLWMVVSLFLVVAIGFLFRAWMVLPAERTWVVPASCTVPAFAILGFLLVRRRPSGDSI